MEPVSRGALHVRKSHPAEGDLAHILGKNQHGYYSAACARLKAAGLAAEWAWAGQTTGWVVAFKHGSASVCRLVLARIPLAGQVSVGRQLHDALLASRLLPDSVMRKLEASPVEGSQRTLELALDTGTGLSQLMALVTAKLKLLAGAGPAAE
ncbi:MAG: DUF3788 family protein [Candidatus Wallbacteria bacterium]|nr:DUF3788 family protein [Candidatus Wallbacteria bacterium]